MHDFASVILIRFWLVHITRIRIGTRKSTLELEEQQLFGIAVSEALARVVDVWRISRERLATEWQVCFRTVMRSSFISATTRPPKYDDVDSKGVMSAMPSANRYRIQPSQRRDTGALSTRSPRVLKQCQLIIISSHAGFECHLRTMRHGST